MVLVLISSARPISSDILVAILIVIVESPLLLHSVHRIKTLRSVG